MFGPLTFPDPPPVRKGPLYNDDQERSVTCIFCDKVFTFPNEKDPCLKHIFHEHHLVIGDAETIADLPKYLEFWKQKMSEAPVKQYCSTMLVDVKKDNVVYSDQEFFLLSDVDKDDKMIREKLQNERTEMALEQQRCEREDNNFSRGCFMCKQTVEPTRREYVKHLNESHNVHLGHPDNLVFLDKFLDTLDTKMDNLQCIYCEKIFKDRVVLKEHMRKKGHKKINPDNQFYDQFYMVNYLGPKGAHWKDKDKRERRPSKEEDEPADWSDWEEEMQFSIMCLFCSTSLSKFEDLLHHMKASHDFDYASITSGFDFYKQVKLVNYVRRQVYWNKCIFCDEMSPCNTDLIEHMVTEKHFKVPSIETWDKPEYFFPTYENDSFLTFIEDDDDDETEVNHVFPEMINSDAERPKEVENLEE